MPDPINYSLDVQAPFQAALDGYKVGAVIRNDQVQQQQQQAAMQAQQQRQMMLAKLAANPAATADDYAQVMTALPDLAEHLTKAWATKNAAQQQSQAADMLQLGAAIKSGKPEIAASRLTDRADMLEQQNGGQATRESQALRTQAQLITDHPEFALGQIQATLAVNPNGKQAADTLASFGGEQRAAEKAPGELRKVNADATAAEADAKTKTVTAEFAHQNAVADLEKKGWDVKNIQSEIGYRKESNRIAAMTAGLAAQTNELKRKELQLQIDKASQDLADKVRTKAADVESATSTIDNLLNTVDRIKQNPALKDVIGSLEGSDWYPNQLAAASTVVSPYGLFASSGDERADAIAMIKTLGSQTFLAMVPQMKGTGNLSDAEGKKLESGLQSLSRQQSETQFMANLDEVQRLMLKARKNVETRYGVKAAPPDTPAVKTSPEDITALVNKYLNPKPPGAR